MLSPTKGHWGGNVQYSNIVDHTHPNRRYSEHLSERLMVQSQGLCSFGKVGAARFLQLQQLLESDIVCDVVIRARRRCKG